MSQADPGRPETYEAGPPEPSGLGGWLILLGFGLVVAPLRLGAFLVQVYAPLFGDGTWEMLTVPGGDAYHPLWAPILISELAMNGVFLVGSVVMIFLFFQRSRRFPTFYVAFSIANCLFILADAWLISLVLPDEPMFDPETAREFGRSLITVFIWVPYVLVSKRVRNTFVE